MMDRGAVFFACDLARFLAIRAFLVLGNPLCFLGLWLDLKVFSLFTNFLSTMLSGVSFSLHRPPLPLLTPETMKTSQDKPRQAKRFETPRRIEQPADQFGCVGFISYGFIQYANGEIIHVRNPDFNWSAFSR
jgi:hypothetical protein